MTVARTDEHEPIVSIPDVVGVIVVGVQPPIVVGGLDVEDGRFHRLSD